MQGCFDPQLESAERLTLCACIGDESTVLTALSQSSIVSVHHIFALHAY